MSRCLSTSLPPPYSIVLARSEHLTAVADIESRAGVLFHGPAYDGISDDTVPLNEFIAGLLGGYWWMALAAEIPVGFALIKMLTPEHPHLEELDVLPEHGRRGLGTALLRTVQSWVAGSGHREISLTTFRDVPWNAPFYTRCGFEEVPPAEVRPELRTVIARETARGLAPERRVVMRYRAKGR